MARSSLPPGFRFHPTDVELVWYYLKRKVMGKPFRFESISVVDLYKFSPWDLPAQSVLPSRDLEWYFFCPRDRKYSHGSRTNRATETGYWKTTGKDRAITHNSLTVGMKKTLIFHLGKPPNGSRTDWVMYEFRLDSDTLVSAGFVQDKFVLCKIFQKSGPGPRNGEQYGAPFVEEDWDDDGVTEHGGIFPSLISQEKDHLLNPVPLQTIPPQVGNSDNFQVGGPSSEIPPNNLAVGEPILNFGGPSSVSNPIDAGEPSFSSMLSDLEQPSGLACSGSREFPCVPETPYSDGILLAQLEEFLNMSPSYLQKVNDESFCLSLLNDMDPNQAPDQNLDTIYNDLGDLPVETYPAQADAFGLSDSMTSDFELQTALAEVAEEHYVQLSDFTLANQLSPFGDSAGLDSHNGPYPSSFANPNVFNSHIDTYPSFTNPIPPPSCPAASNALVEAHSPPFSNPTAPIPHIVTGPPSVTNTATSSCIKTYPRHQRMSSCFYNGTQLNAPAVSGNPHLP